MMASILNERHSPIRSGVAPKLRHRSRPSESENHAREEAGSTPPDDETGGPSDWNNRDESDSTQESDGDESYHPPEKNTVKNRSLLSYFMTELTRDYKLEGEESEFVERRDRVYTSVNTPTNFEKFCVFGFLQCLDSILYMVTFLPIRILVAVFRLLTYPCTAILFGARRTLDAAQVCDLLKGTILVVSCFIISHLDIAAIYHDVKKNSIFKFYVYYNMLDVMDKLVSGFGQDVLDSLYWTAVDPHSRKREHFGTLFHLIFAVFYVVVHTTIIIIQAITLNAAFNTHDQNLLTVVLSSNFIEIKGNLFKRLDKNNLCQISYSDVKERFHLNVLVLFAFMLNLKDLGWTWSLAFRTIQNGAFVLVIEVIVDWIKHAFITKFNELSATSYADFALGLAEDIASSQKKHAFTNFSDQVCRRMGFTPMPLICLLFMACYRCFSIRGVLPWLLVFLFYLCLMSSKVLISIILLGWAQRLITAKNRTTATKLTATVVNSQVMPKKESTVGKSKSNSQQETPPMPVIINTRPMTVSSSIAVNTDASLTLDPATINPGQPLDALGTNSPDQAGGEGSPKPTSKDALDPPNWDHSCSFQILEDRVCADLPAEATQIFSSPVKESWSRENDIPPDHFAEVWSILKSPRHQLPVTDPATGFTSGAGSSPYHTISHPIISDHTTSCSDEQSYGSVHEKAESGEADVGSLGQKLSPYGSLPSDGASCPQMLLRSLSSPVHLSACGLSHGQEWESSDHCQDVPHKSVSDRGPDVPHRSDQCQAVPHRSASSDQCPDVRHESDQCQDVPHRSVSAETRSSRVTSNSVVNFPDSNVDS